MPIQVIWGNDSNACNKEVERIIDSKISIHWRDLNLSRLNGDYPEQFFQALEDIKTSPFGDGARIVHLKNNPIFNVKNELYLHKFDSLTTELPVSNYLILQNEQKPDARIKTTKLLKNFIQNGLAIESSFNLPDIWDSESQINFIINSAKEINLKIDKKTAIAINETIGFESVKLNNELQKANLYLASKNKIYNSKFILNETIVRQIFNDHQSNIFKIIDLLLEKNISKSLKEIYILINRGEPSLRINAGLISQLRIHLIVLLLEKEKDLSTISKIAGISNPKRIFFIRKKVKDWTSKELIELINKFINIELKLKQGSDPINIYAETLSTLN